VVDYCRVVATPGLSEMPGRGRTGWKECFQAEACDGHVDGSREMGEGREECQFGGAVRGAQAEGYGEAELEPRGFVRARRHVTIEFVDKASSEASGCRDDLRRSPLDYKRGLGSAVRGVSGCSRPISTTLLRPTAIDEPVDVNPAPPRVLGARVR
jgi:hypothetical protein